MKGGMQMSSSVAVALSAMMGSLRWSERVTALLVMLLRGHAHFEESLATLPIGSNCRRSTVMSLLLKMEMERSDPDKESEHVRSLLSACVSCCYCRCWLEEEEETEHGSAKLM